MKNIIHPSNHFNNRRLISHISDIKLYFPRELRIRRLQPMSHIILFLFISRKNSNFREFLFKIMLQYSMTKRACSSCDQQNLPIVLTIILIHLASQF